MKDFSLFLDESGHHGLRKGEQEFPIFLLCGCIIENYYCQNSFAHQFERIKFKYFKNKKIIFHSRDIRKWEKEFKVLGEVNLRNDFYNEFNGFIKNANFSIIASAIKKNDLIEKYGPQASNPYNLSLGFIIERAVFFSQKNKCKTIKVIAESRGKREDNELQEQYQLIKFNGTKYVQAEDLQKIFVEDLQFIKKKDNNLGTQLSDMVAYPIATKIIYPERVNLAFDIIESKFHRQFEEEKEYLGYGLKIFP